MIPSSRKVSVVIPVFNRSGFLSEAVESVIATRYPNLEILIIDDGSTDNTFRVAEDLARKHAGAVRLSQHPDQKNHGAGASRNLGINIANGDYVCFLDSDDYVLPHRFESSVAILDDDPTIDGVYESTQAKFVGAGEARIGIVQPIVALDCQNPDKVLEIILSPQQHWTVNAILLRKSVFARVGLFPEQFKICEDLAMWLKLACTAKLVAGSENPVAVYRLHGQNISGIADVLHGPLLAVLDVYLWAKRNNINEEKLELLRKALTNKLLYVSDTYRKSKQPNLALQHLLNVLPHLPSLATRKSFWTNLLGSVRESVALRY